MGGTEDWRRGERSGGREGGSVKEGERWNAGMREGDVGRKGVEGEGGSGG